ncbi:hypothetical protein [Streptomyces sp. NPDC058953]|uniref:hypothetical protein n=1 Tax=Streptomyces sp. NPDC058953 TaxID=3346676 RepID=UPI0036A58527
MRAFTFVGECERGHQCAGGHAEEERRRGAVARGAHQGGDGRAEGALQCAEHCRTGTGRVWHASEGECGGGGEDLPETEEADADQAQGPEPVEISGGGDEQYGGAGHQEHGQSGVQQEPGVVAAYEAGRGSAGGGGGEGARGEGRGSPTDAEGQNVLQQEGGGGDGAEQGGAAAKQKASAQPG